MFELYIEDLLYEINILNYYRGEAAKRKDVDAVVVETAAEQREALLCHMRSAVTDVLMLAPLKSLKFTCEHADDKLKFELSPVREGTEHLIPIFREAVRQYIVYEVRRLWMMLNRPDWAEYAQRAALLGNIKTNIGAIGKSGRVRRRATDLAGI